jgi:predicted ATPase
VPRRNSWLIEGHFACQPLGAQSLKGVATSVELYQVLGEGPAHNRLEVAGARGLTPFVGREQELGLLHERWEQATEGHGQVVLLTGEAGIGKSRLIQTLKERVAGQPVTHLEASCSPYHQNSALYPVIELLQRVLQFQQDDSPEEKLHKLETSIVGAHGHTPLHEVVPLLTSLLSLPLPDRYPLLTFTPQKQKEKTQYALLTWLLQETDRKPTLLVWEDLHWADPSTLEFLALLLDQVPTTRLLLVLTFRPDFIPSWATHLHFTSLTLDRLNRKQVETMIAQVATDKALSTEVIQQVVTKADGVPLFVEELTKIVLESIGSQSSEVLQAIPIPTTLRTLHEGTGIA